MTLRRGRQKGEEAAESRRAVRGSVGQEAPAAPRLSSSSRIRYQSARFDPCLLMRLLARTHAVKTGSPPRLPCVGLLPRHLAAGRDQQWGRQRWGNQLLVPSTGPAWLVKVPST